MVLQAPGMEYAVGYNPKMGDGSTLFRTKMDMRRHQ